VLHTNVCSECVLNEVMCATAIHEHHYLVAEERAKQAECFRCQMSYQRIKTNLGLGQVNGFEQVKSWVKAGYIRNWGFVFVRDKEKNPRGTTVASMVFLVATKTKVAFSARRDLLRRKAFEGWSW